MRPSSIIAPELAVEDIVRAALAEDLGDAGDLTTRATIPASAVSSARIVARRDGVISGVSAALAAFQLIDPPTECTVLQEDGSLVTKGESVMTLHGPSRAILTAERVALNFLGHLSGIATATRALVDAVNGTGVAIACTRKTTPGLRGLEKAAVRHGGGRNHRFGLYDAVMIKDNHIIAAGGIAPALRAAKAAIGHMHKIEIEVDTLDQLGEVLSEGADVILLDNMSTDQLREAVSMASGQSILEASGNVTIDTVRAIAETGVDVISSGWITHSAPTLDLGMDFDR